MNGRGYKRTGDFDEIIIRKRCRILDPAEVVGDTGMVGNLDVTGDITLTGTVDGVDVAAIGGSSILTDLEAGAGAENTFIRPVNSDLRLRLATGSGATNSAAVNCDPHFGGGEGQPSAVQIEADKIVNDLGDTSNESKAFVVCKGTSGDVIVIDTSTTPDTMNVTGDLDVTGDITAVDMIATRNMYVGNGTDTAFIRTQTGAGNLEIRASDGVANPAVKLIPSSGSVIMEATGATGKMILSGGNIEQSFYVKNTGGTVLLETDGDPNGTLSVNVPVALNTANIISTGNVSCATLTVGGDATTGFTAPVNATNLIAGSGAGAALDTGATNNTAVGEQALASVTTGEYNTCIGSGSGGIDIITGDNNICLGYNAVTDADYSNCIVVGANATGYASNQAIIGSAATTELSNEGNGVCDLGSSGRQFKDLYLSGEVKLGGSSLLAFSQPQDTTNLCAGPTQGDSLAADALRNIIIGSGSAGDSLTTGDDNIIIGTSNCATALTTGSRNIIIGGENCAKTMTSGTNNVIIGTGDCADTFVFSNSVQIGDNAGSAGMGNTSVAVGASAGQSVSGAGNVCLGYNTGGSGTGKENTYLGYSASVANTKEYSVALGTRASCAESRQMVLGSSDTTTYSLTEVVPGSTDGSCHLGSTTKKFGTVYCTALDVNGSGVDGFTNPVDDTNMVAGTTAGDSLTGAGSVRNVLIGKNAGTAMTTGCVDNTCVGYEAGKTAGASTVENTFIGAGSGGSVTTGNSNTCVGDTSGFALTTGNSNTLIGKGGGNITTGIRNTSIGSTTLPSAENDYQIAIGYQATCGASEECCIGGINSGQSVTVIKPGRDDYTSLGDSSNRFTDLHLTGAVVDEIPAAITSTDSPYTMGNTDHVIRCDTTTNLIQITLPAASSNNGTRYIIALETDPSGNDVTISRAGSDTINGATTPLTLVDAGSAWTVYAIGTNWYATATN